MPLASPSRTVTAVDSTADGLPTFPLIQGWLITQPSSLAIVAVCTVASATLTCRPVYRDQYGDFVSIGPMITIFSQASADYMGEFTGTPIPASLSIPVDADMVSLKVDSLTQGSSWQLGALLVGGRSI
jgi:hypothetical protein